ncbi:glyoxalase [Primorskyibacter flagellatus]|uniref:Glyoxalase n=1 Tax=Primorskyibacter flagellatus TaxID=1387277 RepID=A0A917A2J8_9RHOB|nr:VOC family protein [Primorskyibacter flagellatus]GGE22193.1 glyoxalase [Primorskyibacter flagellatus]
MGLKRINFTDLPVADYQRALEFYRDTLGMGVQTDADYGPGGRWIFLTVPGAETMLHFVPSGQLTRPEGQPALYLVCDDADAEAARLKAAGVAIHSGPDDAPWDPTVRWVMIHDSEGNLVLLQSSQSEGA